MKLAIVFPGQGSQAVGMLAGYAEHPLVRETFVEASQVLGQDLWALGDSGPAGALNEPVNFNAPGQVVIAGHKEAVERAIVAAKARGAKRGLLLPVSAPFHSKLLQPAAEKLAAYLAEVPVRVATVAVLHTVDVARAATPEAVRAALARQAASPVRWVETIQAFVAQGVTHIIESGPGAVLTGLARRIAPGVEVLPLNDANAIAAAIVATASSGP